LSGGKERGENKKRRRSATEIVGERKAENTRLGRVFSMIPNKRGRRGNPRRRSYGELEVGGQVPAKGFMPDVVPVYRRGGDRLISRKNRRKNVDTTAWEGLVDYHV